MHACYEPRLPLEKQEIETLLWTGLRGFLPEPHYSGKKAIVGHTSQKNGKILDAGMQAVPGMLALPVRGAAMLSPGWQAVVAAWRESDAGRSLVA